jgi:hypothetical protein
MDVCMETTTVLATKQSGRLAVLLTCNRHDDRDVIFTARLVRVKTNVDHTRAPATYKHFHVNR